MPGRPGEADEQASPEQLRDWLRRAVPVTTCAFEESGAGLLIVGRGPLAIRDDVLLLRYDQVAQIAGAFLLNIVAPGMAAAVAAQVQLQGRHFPGNISEADNGPAPT